MLRLRGMGLVLENCHFLAKRGMMVIAVVTVASEQRRDSSCPWPPAGCPAAGMWQSVVRLEAQGQAGLLDRLSVIRHAGNVAASLCARLAVGPPCKLLASDRHNYGQPLRCGGEGWARYANVSYAAVADVSPLSSRLPKKAQQLTSFAVEDVAKDYRRVEHWARSGLVFEWIIRSKYMEWKRKLEVPGVVVTSGQQGCSSVLTEPSRRAVELADNLADKPWFAALHVRRGDELRLSSTQRRHNQSLCPTDVASVIAYATRCAATESLVIFTDERDAAYCSSLLAALGRALPGVRVVHGDAILRSALARSEPGPEDNFLVFAAALVVMRRAEVRLRMQRGHCGADCGSSRKKARRDHHLIAP